MSIDDRVDTITKVLTEKKLVNEIDIDEFRSIILENNVKPKDYEKIAKTMIYVRQRFTFKKSRYESFKIAFPDRCETTDNRNTIETKAIRVEEYPIYKKIVGLLSTSLYISHAMDRLYILDDIMDKIKNHDIKDRDRIEYMRLFLQETRKSDDSKGMELNVNLTQNNVSISKVEQTMSAVSKKLEGLDANKILEIIDGN